MSASNWAMCRNCIDKYNKEKKRVDDLYGRVPLEEYKRLTKEIPPNPEVLENSLREDYEIGIDITGKFFVSYLASCENCEFEYRFKRYEDTNI